jgi:hypothetical protein
MTDIRPGANTQAQFFSSKNETMLDRLLYADFQRRIGGDLTSKQKERLDKTVKHYMTEVYAKNPDQSIQYMNKEVLTSVVPDYLSYLRRNGPAKKEEADSGLHMDVNSRFDKLQTQRQEMKALPPPPPDFQLSLEDEGPTPLSRFEEVKRIREAEARREAEMAATMSANRGMDVTSQELVVTPTRDTDMGRFLESDTEFRNGAEAARQRDQLAIIMREAEQAAGMQSTGRTEIINLPDPRRILLGDALGLNAPARSQAIPNANPTLSLPERMREKPVLPQDVLKPQDDIVAYKEVEHNLFVYSADRDWVSNTTENRYNFSVIFDPANNQSGFGYNTATQVKFKNIVRIEFVKAIMPTEGIDVLPVYDMSGAVSVLNTDLNVSVLSLPYLQVRIPELNVNGYGTNDGMNNAFAAISYDAYWTGDSNTKNKGFARMIPKFLKCQKVYYPTPLATLQKLSFQIQKPDGTLVSTTNDTLDISGIYMPTTGTSVFKHYFAATYDWLWIKTKTYFNKFLVSQGDRIIFKNIAMNATLVAAQPTGVTNLVNFLTRPEGHLVSDIGALTGTDASPTYRDTGVNGPGYSNAAGYSNGIIIRNSFADPTTGSTSLSPWVTAGFVTSLESNPTATSGRLINMNHQIQIIMRVITREMDSAAKLRPDNLQA